MYLITLENCKQSAAVAFGMNMNLDDLMHTQDVIIDIDAEESFNQHLDELKADYSNHLKRMNR